MNLKLVISNDPSVATVNSPATLCRVSQTPHWSPEEGGRPEEPGASSRPANRQSWPGLHRYPGIQAEYDQQEVDHPARIYISRHRCQLGMMVLVGAAATFLMTILTVTETRCLLSTEVTTEDTTAPLYI